MKRIKERKTNRKDGESLLLMIMMFVVIVFVGVFAFLRFYNSYIDGILYRERLHQMKEVTTQVFKGIEDVVQYQWDNTDVFCNYVELGKPEDTDTLLVFLSKQAKLNGMDDKNAKIVAVDDLGRYLTQDGWQGTLEEMNLLLDNPEKISFTSKSMTTNETYMYFLKRLEEPIVLQDGNRTVNLIYYGVAQDMERLNPYFTCKAYDDNNSVYVIDNHGARIFSSSSILPGYNVYNTLEEMQYLHNNSFAEAKKELDTTGYGYSNAILEGEEYYYALYRMDNAEWTLLFLVSSSNVATDVVTMVNTTVRLIMIFAILLFSIASLAIFMVLRFKQRQAIEIERSNNEKLEEINEELDHKNGELTKAVHIAEEATRRAEIASERAELAMVEAQTANKAKTDFLSNMSHDIRTPMNAIVGITNLMAHEKEDSEKLDIYIQKVQSSSKHLLSLINDVLDMSKIESSEVTLNTEQINIAEQVGQIDSIIRPQVEERKQTLAVHVHKIVHEAVIGDSVRLRQVFINLLSNAVKYTPDGGMISLDIAELTCEKSGYAKYSITVTDNGYGMKPEFVKHIFEPFTRAENSTTNKIQGTGLGMAITKNIVNLMNGTITVHSEIGKGSRFEVTVMLAIDESVEYELPAKNILLIADEDELICNVDAALRESDTIFHSVRTQKEAIEILTAEKVNVVLLGGHLHDRTLADTVKQIRDTAKDAVLIFCCDYANQEQAHDILSTSGADGLVTRPFFFSNFAYVLNQSCSEDTQMIGDDTSILKGMRFLCAEDNDLNAEILEAILDMNGATCTIYPNGQAIVDAFDSVQPGDYDAILMDVQMPVMNGLEATKIIRQSGNPLGKMIPIIAMTANAFSSDVHDCLEAGMNAHVSKPLDIAVLGRTLKSLNNAMFSGGGQLYAHKRHSRLKKNN